MILFPSLLQEIVRKMLSPLLRSFHYFPFRSAGRVRTVNLYVITSGGTRPRPVAADSTCAPWTYLLRDEIKQFPVG